MRFLEEKHKVTVDEYEDKKQYYLKKYIKQDFIAVPIEKGWEQRLVEVMTKSNHWLCKKIMRYQMSTRTLSFYTFSRAKVLIEKPKGEDYIYIAFPKSLGAFKYMVAKELFCNVPKYKQMFKRLNIQNGDVTKVVDMFGRWIEGDRNVSFSTMVRNNV